MPRRSWAPLAMVSLLVCLGAAIALRADTPRAWVDDLSPIAAPTGTPTVRLT
jgi:hypothetical protein